MIILNYVGIVLQIKIKKIFNLFSISFLPPFLLNVTNPKDSINITTIIKIKNIGLLDGLILPFSALKVSTLLKKVLLPPVRMFLPPVRMFLPPVRMFLPPVHQCLFSLFFAIVEINLIFLV